MEGRWRDPPAFSFQFTRLDRISTVQYGENMRRIMEMIYAGI